MDADKGDHLAELMTLMADSLGYNFTKVDIRRGIYSPKAHGDLEFEQLLIRRFIIDVISGKKAIPTMSQVWTAPTGTVRTVSVEEPMQSVQPTPTKDPPRQPH